MKVIALEFFKLRRKRVVLLALLILAIEIGWALTSVSISMARAPERAGWEGVLLTVISMNGLFLPILCALVVSRICDMEHKGNMWRFLFSAALRPQQIYRAKYVCTNSIIFIVLLLQISVMVLFGLIRGFDEPIPVHLLLYYLFFNLLVTLVVIALQQWISLVFPNQAYALILGLIGGFFGLAADLLPNTISRVLIWSYYTGLSPITYRYTNETLEFVSRSAELHQFLLLALFAVVIYVSGRLHVSKIDV